MLRFQPENDVKNDSLTFMSLYLIKAFHLRFITCNAHHQAVNFFHDIVKLFIDELLKNMLAK
jgi:hypothetical protein